MEFINKILVEEVEIKVQEVKKSLEKSGVDEEIINLTVQSLRKKEEEKFLVTTEEAKKQIEEALNKTISDSTFRRALKEFPFKVMKSSNKKGLKIYIGSVYDYVKAETSTKAELIAEIDALKIELAKLKEEKKKEVISSENEQIKEESNAPDGQTSIFDELSEKDRESFEWSDKLITEKINAIGEKTKELIPLKLTIEEMANLRKKINPEIEPKRLRINKDKMWTFLTKDLLRLPQETAFKFIDEEIERKRK